jgi:RHS repeat-associated protein
MGMKWQLLALVPVATMGHCPCAKSKHDTNHYKVDYKLSLQQVGSPFTELVSPRLPPVSCPFSTVYNLSFNNGVGPSVSQMAITGSTTASANYTVGVGMIGLYSPLQQINGLAGTQTIADSGAITYSFSGTNQPLAGQLGGKMSLNFSVSPNGVVSGQLTAQAKFDLDNGQGQSSWNVSGNALASVNPNTCFGTITAGDPVVMSTGESVSDPTPDLWLLRRHYGSLVKANGVSGRLGPNWTHNFETKLVILGTNATVMFFDGAAIEFAQSGGKYVLDQKQPLAYQLAQVGTNYQFLDAATNLIYTFSSTGALMRIEDRNGNALTITQPNQISDGLGRTLTFTYGSDGNLASVQDQTGRTVSFTYSGGNLATVADANGKVTTYNYTSAFGKTGLLTSVKRPAGNITLTQSWDQLGRVARQMDGLNNSTAFAYDNPAGTGVATDPLGNKTAYAHADLRNNSAITDANGKMTTTVRDAANRPTLITDRLGNRTILAYDPASGLEVSSTDASGAVTSQAYTAQTQGPFTFYVLSKRTYPDGTFSTYSYDPNGNLLSTTDRAGGTTQIAYNKRGQALMITDAAGGVTTNTYNDDGTLASTKSPAGDTTMYGYDAQKRVVKLTHPDGTIETYTYDARDRVLQHTVGSGAPQTYTYDDNGNLRSDGVSTYNYDANDRLLSVASGGATVSVTLDELGRPKTATNAAGERISGTYDAVGQPMAILDAAGNGYRFGWNAEGFLQSITDSLSHTTMLATDPLGRLLSLTTPLGEKYSYGYDKSGRRISETTPLSHTRKSTYDAQGELARVDLPLNIGAAYMHDGLGQVSAITDPNGGVWRQSHDSLGRLSATADPLSQTTTVQYGSGNRVSGASNAAGSMNLSHDSNGNLTRAQFSDGTNLNYQYTGRRMIGADNLSLAYGPTGLIVSCNGIANTWDAEGRLTSVTYGPGLTVTYKYNSLGLLMEVDDWMGGATMLRWDTDRRLISAQRPNGATTTYLHDANGRLVGKNESTASGNYSIALKLDAEGNAISADRSLPQAPQPAEGFNGYSYDAAHQIAGAAYDASGRLLSDGLRTYAWDLASRLTSYSGMDGAAQFTYDGLGQRVSRTTADGEQHYVWNYAHPLPALDIVRSGGADLRYYVYLPGGTLMYSIEAADNSRHYYHFDEAGSTTFLTDDGGAVSDAYGITPFGESVTQAGATANPFTFHGAYGVMQEGATSMYYMRARYYDSASGRFLSRDPIPSLDPLRIDPYQFALNNPIGFHDPRGTNAEPANMRSICDCMKISLAQSHINVPSVPEEAFVRIEGYGALNAAADLMFPGFDLPEPPPFISYLPFDLETPANADVIPIVSPINLADLVM